MVRDAASGFTLVLLPGMDGTGELFAPLLNALNPGLRTTVVSYADRPATYAEHESVALAELPKDRPFAILGESFSGPIAVTIAAQPTFASANSSSLRR